MAVRRRLNRIRLDKIAAVDSPCQEHATVAIIKRAPVADTTPKGIAKATFQEALEGNMIAGAVNEAFFQSFDGLWERNDAFRVALTDELAAGGDGETASAAYIASVRTLVDQAVGEARKAGATAADTTAVEKALTAAVERWLGTQEERTMKISTKAELRTEVAKFNPQTTPVADVLAIQKAATDLGAEDELPAEGPLAIAKADPKVAEMEREIAILKLAPESRSHFDTLDAAAQTAFLAKSADEQKAAIEAANSKDPVVYKCQDGTEIRKSDGTAAVMLAKRLDAQDVTIAKLSGDLSGSTFEKRAGEEFPHVAKGVAVQMLKSVDQLGKDTDAGKAVLDSLRSMEKAQAGGFRSLGSSEDEGAGGGDIKKLRTDFDSAVAKIAERDKCDRSAAMSKARTEHADLFEKAYPDTVRMAEESGAAAREHHEAE